jgi:hypothetical protein
MPETVRVVFDPQALTALFDTPDSPVAKDLVRRGLQVERAVKQSLKLAGTGRVYRRRNVTHQASAPGQPPATDTGKYAASITSALERDPLGLVEKIGTNDKRGPWLELGTRRMAPRPHLVPGLSAAADV